MVHREPPLPLAAHREFFSIEELYACEASASWIDPFAGVAIQLAVLLGREGFAPQLAKLKAGTEHFGVVADVVFAGA